MHERVISMIASNLLTIHGRSLELTYFNTKIQPIYVLVVDYFSRYPKIAKLTNTTSKGVIAALRSMFASNGIPEVLQSDNGPQYVSQHITDFATSYGFI